MQTIKNKNLYYFLSFVFPLAVYVKFKHTARGVIIYLVSFVIVYFAFLDLNYIFTVSNNYIVENLVIVNIILWSMFALTVRDSIKVMK